MTQKGREQVGLSVETMLSVSVCVLRECVVALFFETTVFTSKAAHYQGGVGVDVSPSLHKNIICIETILSV